MQNINHLPYDCLILLFEQQFELHERISLRAICRRWKALIEQMCSRKLSLKLLGSLYIPQRWASKLPVLNKCYPLDNLNDRLIVARFNVDSCAFLVNIFPHIQQLVLHFHSEAELEAVFYVLDRWKDSLTHLTLSGQYNLNEDVPLWFEETSRFRTFIDYVSSKLTFSKKKVEPKPSLRTQLYDKINALHELRCLNLLTEGLFVLQDDHFLRRCSTFAIELKPNLMLQLEQLSFSSNHASLEPVLRNLGPKCTKLDIDIGLFYTEKWQHMLQGNLAVKNSLEELLLRGYRFVDLKFIELICDNFSNLKVLDLQIWNYANDESDDSSYVYHFAKLRQLTDLTFHLYYPAANALPQDWPQLSTITRLTLLLYVDQCRGGRFDCAHFCATLANLVPNAKTIFIRTAFDKIFNEEEDHKTRDKVKSALENGLTNYFASLEEPIQCS